MYQVKISSTFYSIAMEPQEKISEKNHNEEQAQKTFEEERAEAFKQFMAAHFPLDHIDTCPPK